MTAVAVIPIRQGQRAVEPLSSDFEKLYKLVLSSFVRDAELIPMGSRLTTVPLSGERDLQRTGQKITRYLESIKPEIALVDLANSSRRLLAPYSVFSGIVACIRIASENIGQTIRLVFLLPSPLWENDPPMEIIRPLIESGDAWIITDDGTLTGAEDALVAPVDRIGYVQALTSARSSPLWLLRQKLIRRIGHFGRSDGHRKHCVPFFFDGSACTSELAILFAGRMRNRGITQIFVEHGQSDWILDAVEDTAAELGAALVSIPPNGALSKDQVIDANFAIVAGMCDTADTLTKILGKVRAINPAAQPYVLTVLSTRGDDQENGERLVEVEDRRILVEYLLRVEQAYIPTEECRQCKAGVPFNNPREDDFSADGIRPTAMWPMILEAGLKPEDDVPKSRLSLGLVPNFPEIIERNGPYLASRMHYILDGIPGKLPRNPIIVCPDEKGAHALSNALTSLFPYTVIRIPRPEIDAFATDVGREMHDDWAIQLESLRDRGDANEAIVLDEFNASGGTRALLRELVEAYGLQVRCCFSLFDFAPALKEASDGRVYSMYSINWLDSGD